MTSRIYNLFQQSSQNQSGVSLMLALLVLAAITAISFSLATIVFIELRASRDLIRSEPNLYATLGVTEEALFQYKRYVNERDDGTTVPTLDVSTCTTTDSDAVPARENVCRLGKVSLVLPLQASGERQPINFDQTPKIVTLFAGETKVLPLYSLNDFSLQYGRITLQRVPVGNTGRLLVSLRSIPQDPEQAETVSVAQNLSEGPPLTLNSFFGGFQYELIIKNEDLVNNVQVNIASFGPSGNQNDPRGLPFIGQKVLKVVADYLGLTRTYTVYIPVP